MRKKLALLLTAPVMAGLLWAGGTAVANGGGDCVPQEAQHYSWTGGPIAVDPPPAFPGGSWQANTTIEPHLQGGGDPATWIGEEGVGLHYTSHGSSGLADWFYFQPEVICEPPPTTEPPPPPPPPTTECPDLPETNVPPTTECPPPPTTTEPPPPTTTEPPPPPTTEPPPPPTTEVPPPPTTEVPPPPDTVPPCEENDPRCEPPLRVTPPFTG